MYSERLSEKHKLLIKHIYDNLNVEELKQLKLTIEEAQVSDLPFQDVCKI